MVGIVAQHFKQVFTQALENDAQVVLVCEKVQHLNKVTLIRIVVCVEHLQDVNLGDCLGVVCGLVFDHLDCNFLLEMPGRALHHLSKSPTAQQRLNMVPAIECNIANVRGGVL